MRLVTICNLCKEEASIKSDASTRPELIMDRGEVFTIHCSNCKRNIEIHVNDVKAKQNINLLFGGVIISIIVTLLLLWVLGAIGTITLGIPLLIWQQQSKSVNGFNSYMIRRH